MLTYATCWIDPGGRSGIATLIGGQFAAAEYPFFPACEVIEAMCAEHGPRLSIGWEAYYIRRNVPQTDAHDAIGLAKVAEYLAGKYRCRALPPAAPHTPVPAEQARLRALNWWPSGQKDSQSAAAHLLNYLLQTGNLPPAEAAVLAAARAAR